MSIILSGQQGETPAQWTTATRPATPNTGQYGYNTTTGALDVYNGSSWTSIPMPTSQGSSGQYLQSAGAGAAPAWATLSASGALVKISYLTSGTSFTTQSSTTKIFVECVGGGGGGGNTSGGGTSGGGGSGAYCAKSFTVTGSTAYTYAIGSGGGGSGSGGNTTFTVGGTTITAGGGSPGAQANGNNQASGGSGGSASSGDINVSGGTGQNGNSNGNGQGAASVFGQGGNGNANNNGSGNSAGPYGAGGGGASSNGTGGSGAQGIIRVTEFT